MNRLHPIAVGHHDVGDDEHHSFTLDSLDHLAAVGGLDHLVSGAFQLPSRAASDGGFVIHHKDSSLAGCPVTIRPTVHGRSTGQLPCLNRYSETYSDAAPRATQS